LFWKEIYQNTSLLVPSAKVIKFEWNMAGKEEKKGEEGHEHCSIVITYHRDEQWHGIRTKNLVQLWCIKYERVYD